MSDKPTAQSIIVATLYETMTTSPAMKKKIVAAEKEQQNVRGKAVVKSGLVVDLMGANFSRGVLENLCFSLGIHYLGILDQVAFTEDGQKLDFLEYLDHCQKWFGFAYVNKDAIIKELRDAEVI
jgi:hypothetical protein